MRKIIRHLRNKSEATRHTIVMVTTFGLTFLIAAGWAMCLGNNPSQKQAGLTDDLKPFAILKDSISVEFDDISSGLKDVASGESQTAAVADAQGNWHEVPAEPEPLQEEPPVYEGEGEYIVNPQ